MNFRIANIVIPNHVLGILLFSIYSTSPMHLLSTYCISDPMLCTEKTVLNKTMSLCLRKKDDDVAGEKLLFWKFWKIKIEEWPNIFLFLSFLLHYTWRAAMNLRPKLNQFLFLQCCRAWPVLEHFALYWRGTKAVLNQLDLAFQKEFSHNLHSSQAGMNWSHTTFHVAL